MEIQIKAELKDLKKGFKESQKEVNKLKKDIERIAGPLEKIGKAFTDNAKLAVKLKNINASNIEVKRNNLKLSLANIKAQEKALKMAGKLDEATRKGLEKRKSLLTAITEKEIQAIKDAKKASTELKKKRKAELEQAQRLAVAKTKEAEIAKNISVIAEKNRRIALKTAMTGATQVEKIRAQLAFDLKSLDIQRQKLTAAKRINRETIKGLNEQKALLASMAAKKIAVIEEGSVKKATTLLGRLKEGFSKASLGIIAFNQGLELLGQAIRGLRFLMKGTVLEFADFETALVGVGKTTSLSGDALDEFGVRIQRLSSEIPNTNEGLLKIAEIAGQLGVDGADNLANFAETLTRVQVSTNLTAEGAAEDFTKILNVTGTSINKIDEFASVIVDLGNNFATTESKILRMTNEVARATTAFDVAVEDTAAFATAMSAMGIRAEIGGSVLARAMVRIETALMKGGVELDNLNNILGESAEGFKETFEKDATKATRMFLTNLNRLRKEGKSTIALLEGIGLKGDEVNKVIPPLVKNVDDLDKAFSRARKEFNNATALMVESQKQFDTLNSSIQIMKNRFSTLGTEVGRVLAPAFTALVDVLGSVAKALTMVARSIGILIDLFVALITEGKTLIAIVSTLAAAFLVANGNALILAIGLNKVILGLSIAAGWATTLFARFAPFALLGAKIAIIAAGFFAVLGALEAVAKNIKQLDKLFKFVETAFFKFGSNMQLVFQKLFAWMVRKIRDVLGMIPGMTESVITSMNTLANQFDTDAERTAKAIDALDEKMKLQGKDLDFGFTGKVVEKTKEFLALFSDFVDKKSESGKDDEKIRKNIEAAALTQKKLNKIISKRLSILRELAKIYRENAKIILETQNIGKDSSEVELNNLNSALQAIEARKRLLTLEGKINSALGDRDPLVKALNDQRQAEIQKTAKILDQSVPDRVLKRLSVDVVFGSFKGFKQGMMQVLAIFDQVTMGFFTAIPRLLIDTMGSLGSMFADWFSDGINELSEQLDIAGKAFNNDIMPALSSVGEIIVDSLSAIDDAFGNIFSEGASIISDALMATFEFLGDMLSKGVDLIGSVFSSTAEHISSLFPDDAMAVETAASLGQSENLEKAIGSGMDAVANFLARPQKPLDISANKLTMAADQLIIAADQLQNVKSGLDGKDVASDNQKLGEIAGIAAQAVSATGAAGAAAGAAGGMGLAAAGPAGMFLAMADMIVKAIQALIDFIPNLLNGIAKIFDSLADLPIKILEAAQNITDALLKFVRDFIPNLIKFVQGTLEDMAKLISEMPQMLVSMIQQIPKLMVSLFKVVPDVIKDIVQGLVELWPALILALIEFMVKGIPEIEKAFHQMIPEIINGFVDGFMAALANIAKNIVNLFTGKKIDFGFEDSVDEALKNVERAVTGVGDELFKVADIQAQAKAEKAAKEFEDAIKNAGFDILKLLKDLWMWVFGSLAKLWAWLESAWKWVWEKLQFLWKKLEEIWSAVWDMMEGFWHVLESIWKEVFAALQRIWDGLTDAVMKAFNWVGDLFSKENLQKAFSFGIQPLMDLLNPNKIKEVFQKGMDLLNPSNLLSKMFKFESGGKGTVEKLLNIDVPFVNFSDGGVVPGTANVFGNSKSNDTVPALLSPGEVVLPRSITNDKNVMNLINSIAQGSLEGFAFGGIVKKVEKVFGGGSTGLPDPLAPVLGPVLSTEELLKQFKGTITDSVVRGLKAMMAGTVARQGFQTGGLVGGTGIGDIVPAMLEPGEGVLNKKAVQRLGQQTFQNLNNGGSVGDTNITMDMTINTTQRVDDAFIRNRIMPTMKNELKRTSSNGEFVISRKGIR